MQVLYSHKHCKSLCIFPPVWYTDYWIIYHYYWNEPVASKKW